MRRSERCGRRVGGIHDDQGVAGERCRPPVRKKQRIERRVIRTDHADPIGIRARNAGKLRAQITLPRDADQKAAEAAALAETGVKNAIEGKTVKKVIVVPNRIVNVVAG